MDIMDAGTQLGFLWRLVNATQQGTVKWAANNEYSFRCAIGRFGYRLDSTDEDDFAPYKLSVFRFHGEDQQDPELLSEWKTAQYSPLNDPLQALYNEVKPRVLGFHTVASDMFEDLAALDGGPAEPESLPVPPSDGF